MPTGPTPGHTSLPVTSQGASNTKIEISLSPGEERGIWQGARLAAWHPELAASSRGWGRGVSRGTRCLENCWRSFRSASEVQGHSERPEETPGSLELTAPGCVQFPGGGDTDFVPGLTWSPLQGRRGGLGRWAAAAGPGNRPAGLSCLLGSDSGFREALRCSAAQPRPPTFSLTFPPGFSPPPASLCPRSPPRRFARVRNQRRAIVTVLKETQSRELSGSRAAERRCGWRPRGVPTPSGDCGPGAARPAAHRDADGTAGQQRLLQVPCASAAAAPRRLLRWNRPPFPPARSALPQQCFHPPQASREKLARPPRTVGVCWFLLLLP
ncbi:uncharacterized protein LOC125112481 [Phacochoerus africanus]|uniref:uncharacterized protein LOC125112481 n=1 Tax=Phacochoerus africanus TaxID=41426 RepID=UPI001FD94AB6|nr:uncharacterized protein LOC125112481 [Phacochoerus africanus]